MLEEDHIKLLFAHELKLHVAKARKPGGGNNTGKL
jgi:hypothetical protein